MNTNVSKVISSQLLPFESFSASSAVTQVESMNIHEPPWHINQMNYAARFTAPPLPPPPPLSLGNNSHCQPLRVLRHRRGWQLCRDPTWTCHRPMVGEVDRVSALWPPSKVKVQTIVPCSGHDATMNLTLWGLKKNKTQKTKEGKLKECVPVSVKKLIIARKPIRTTQSVQFYGVFEATEWKWILWCSRVSVTHDDRNKLIQLNSDGFAILSLHAQLGSMLLIAGGVKKIKNAKNGSYNDSYLIWNSRVFSQTLMLNEAVKRT